MNPVFIPPTVARMVFFHPGAGDSLKKFNDQPLAAQIAHVNEDGTINIGVLDAKGNHYARQNVLLIQSGDVVSHGVSHCRWMDYQLGQAERTQRAERVLEEHGRGSANGHVTGTVLNSRWVLRQPRPSVSDIEKFIDRFGSENVCVQQNGDVYTRLLEVANAPRGDVKAAVGTAAKNDAGSAAEPAVDRPGTGEA